MTDETTVVRRWGSGEPIRLLAAPPTIPINTAALAAAVARATDQLVDAFKPLAEAMRTAAQAMVRVSERLREAANTPAHVAGMEARYYVRAAMDPDYATPEALSLLVRGILDPDLEVAEGLWLMSPANRRLVAVSAMRGWVDHRDGDPVQVCAHRAWGDTQVQVRCG